MIAKGSRDKVYVEVIARIDRQGRMTPLSVQWEDGRKYQVDKVLDMRNAASLKAGGMGLRYQVRILGKETYLFWEADRWFVERRNQGNLV